MVVKMEKEAIPHLPSSLKPPQKKDALALNYSRFKEQLDLLLMMLLVSYVLFFLRRVPLLRRIAVTLLEYFHAVHRGEEEIILTQRQCRKH